VNFFFFFHREALLNRGAPIPMDSAKEANEVEADTDPDPLQAAKKFFLDTNVYSIAPARLRLKLVYCGNSITFDTRNDWKVALL